MTQEDMIRMARKAGFEFNSLGGTFTNGKLDEHLANFAAMVAAAEREECAKECERMMVYPRGLCAAPAHQDVWEAAKAIRARGQHE